MEHEKEKEIEESLTRIHRPSPPFPHRLKKKVDDGKFSKFMAMLKQLSVNVHFKFMKVLVTKKVTISYKPMDNRHHCSVIATRLLVQKKADSGVFTISCMIGAFSFSKILCDLGVNINLIPLAIY